MIKIRYELDCHCDASMTCTVVNLDNPQPDGSILIDLRMAAEQVEMTCEACGCTTYTGDLDTVSEPSDCPGRNDDGEG